MRLLLLILLSGSMAVLIAGSAFAQKVAPVTQRDALANLWLVRSQTITEDLVKDATGFKPSGRALLWARLGQQWWRDDPERARAWILKSIEVVEAVPNRENPAERNLRLATARMLLNIVAPLDEKSSKRLIGTLSETAETVGELERRANAEGLVEAALSIVDTDPRRAAELGASALRIGRPTSIAWLVLRLRWKDPKLGDALFSRTIEVARQTFDLELINSLSHSIFPESMQPGAAKPGLPDEMRTELLKLDLAFLQANPINEANRDSICMSVGSFIAPVLGHFENLLPQQAPLARQSINQCHSRFPLAEQRIDDALNTQPLNTVEALLKAGDDSADMKVRTVYQYRAAALAREKKDFERALKIMDSMSTESREFMNGAWELIRVELAVQSALSYYKSGDVYGMRFVINAAPADLQPLVRIGFLWELPETRNKETDPTLEFLNDARTGLGRSKFPDAEKWSYYFALLKLSVQYQPSEATTALKEAVAALNRVERSKAKETDNNKPDSLDGSGFLRTIPASIMEMDEYAVREALSSITAPEFRAQVRLALLEGCLEKLRSLKQTKLGAKPGASN